MGARRAPLFQLCQGIAPPLKANGAKRRLCHDEADAGKLDRDLLDLFIEARVFQRGIVN